MSERVVDLSNQDGQLCSIWLSSTLSIAMCGFFLFAPRYLPSSLVGIVIGVVPAIYMQAFLSLYPDTLRTRCGSLRTAILLVIVLWLIAIGALLGILSGAIR